MYPDDVSLLFEVLCDQSEAVKVALVRTIGEALEEPDREGVAEALRIVKPKLLALLCDEEVVARQASRVLWSIAGTDEKLNGNLQAFARLAPPPDRGNQGGQESDPEQIPLSSETSREQATRRECFPSLKSLCYVQMR